MTARRNWSREELILAFNLYSRIPFGTINSRNPRIIELARLLGRTVGSVALKLANFARLDPALQKRGIKGLSHGGRGDEDVWREFSEQPEELVFESQRLMAMRLGTSVEELSGIETRDLPSAGREREALVRVRVNQSLFRDRVLSAYGYRCCVTGLTVRPLLIASHVIPWTEDPGNRLNPRNGLCLNALHDRAFDRQLMWIDEGFVIRLSTELRKKTAQSKQTVDWLQSSEGKTLLLPKHFQPDPVLLARHAAQCQ
ncbi:MAG: HNH endonuclease [candidate division Zixibacteria bacterium]|nr:HNH endonuclease [candidate division Zixibacteria bacterium]